MQLRVVFFSSSEILDSFNLGSPQQIQAKLDLWSYDILEVIVVTLKQDFSKLLNGWTTAAKLATILAYDFLMHQYMFLCCT